MGAQRRRPRSAVAVGLCRAAVWARAPCRWELLPHYCQAWVAWIGPRWLRLIDGHLFSHLQVVQGRRAEHSGRGWLQAKHIPFGTTASF